MFTRRSLGRALGGGVGELEEVRSGTDSKGTRDEPGESWCDDETGDERRAHPVVEAERAGDEFARHRGVVSFPYIFVDLAGSIGAALEAGERRPQRARNRILRERPAQLV